MVNRLPPIRRRAGTALRTLAELAGIACLVAAAWTLAPSLGLAVLGLGLILAANFAGRSEIP